MTRPQRRQSVYVDSFAHANPIPAACRIGNLIFSGVITGRDRETGRPAVGLDKQCRLMFEHLREIVQAAGASTDDIAKITVHLKDRSDRVALNREWLSLFPDAANRPARHAHTADLDGDLLITCEFVAVISV